MIGRMSEPLLNAVQVARRLGIPAARVKRLAKAGELPHVALPGNELRFDAEDLDRWVASYKRGPELPPAEEVRHAS